MIIRNLDENGDWKFGRGIQDYLTNKPALELDIKTRLKSWKGDCFFDTEEGVDYKNYLDIGTKDLLDRDIKRVVLQTGGVLKISKFTSTLSREDRELSIEMVLSTIFGTVNVGGVI